MTKDDKPSKRAILPPLARLSQLEQAGDKVQGWEGGKRESVQWMGIEIRL
jgi:hypothetical protein